MRSPGTQEAASSNLFSHDFFQTFYVYIFLAVALVWQVVRTTDSLRRQYTEDHWVIFFSLTYKWLCHSVHSRECIKQLPRTAQVTAWRLDIIGVLQPRLQGRVHCARPPLAHTEQQGQPMTSATRLWIWSIFMSKFFFSIRCLLPWNQGRMCVCMSVSVYLCVCVCVCVSVCIHTWQWVWVCSG